MSAGPRAHIAVLRNPGAGRGRHRAEVVAALAALRSGGHEVRLLAADTVADALRACRDAVTGGPGDPAGGAVDGAVDRRADGTAGGAAALVVVGGDGTVHLAIQAVAGTGVPFGVIPAGTGNDFATEVGVPTDVVAAAESIADALRADRTVPVDLARMVGPDGYDRWFAAVLAAGFDAIVNERANRMRWPRGRRRYDLAIAAELARLRARRYVVVLDGQKREHDAILVAVGNTSSYGGGLKMCPAADPHDGLLDVVIGARMSRRTLIRLQPRLAGGTHVLDPLVTTYRARTVEIYADGITGYADGERACALPVTVTADPGALRLLQ